MAGAYYWDLIRRLDRAARISILGIQGLFNEGANPPHRPPSGEVALRNDEIVQTFLGLKSHHPEWKQKEILFRVGRYYGVSRSYIYRLLQQLSPERRANIEASFRAMKEAGGTMTVDVSPLDHRTMK